MPPSPLENFDTCQMGYTQNGAIFGAIFQLDTFPEMTILLGVFFILLVIMSYWLDKDIVHIHIIEVTMHMAVHEKSYAYVHTCLWMCLPTPGAVLKGFFCGRVGAN